MAAEASQPRVAEDLPSTPANGGFLPGISLAMQGIEHVLAEIASTDLPVLILGERGTGKEALASRLHQISSRRQQAFTKLTCAGLQIDALSGFLVRSVNGDGSCEGTLFFDEVSDLETSCQAALSEFLSESEKLPEEQARRARVACSTSRNIEERIRTGQFREDLYFQISAVSLRLPPLRHRKADIPGLLEFFLRKSAAQFGCPQPSLSPWAQQALLDYSWPGNIRELENASRNIVALGDERLGLADLYRSGLDLPFRDGAPAGTSLKEAARAASRRAERELMLRVLTRTRWNRKLAAKELQISYKALLYKLKYLGLEDSASS